MRNNINNNNNNVSYNFATNLCFGLIWQFIKFEGPLHSHVSTQMGKFHFDELSGV